MANRPILPIEIDGSEFDRFKQKFDEYKKTVGEIPEQWSKTNKIIGENISEFENLNETVKRQYDLIHEYTNDIEKSEQTAGSLSTTWTATYRYGRLWSGEIKNATLQLGKWAGLTTVFSSLLSAGGLYGIQHMATSVSTRRTSALGLGTTIGAQSAFLTNFGRLGNAEGILRGTSQALNDPRSQVFRTLGVSGKVAGMDAPHAFAAILPDIEKLLKRTPENQLSAVIEGYGLGELGIGLEQGRFIKRASHAELEKMREGFSAHESQMGIESVRKWTEFETALDKASAIVGRAFKVNIVKLTEPLGRVADEFSTLLPILLRKGGLLNKLIDSFGKEIDTFAKWIGNDHAIDAFGKQVDQTMKQFDAANKMLSEHSTMFKTIFGALVGAYLGGKVGGGFGVVAGGVLGALTGFMAGFDRNRDLTPKQRELFDEIGRLGAKYLPEGLRHGGATHLPGENYQSSAERMRRMGGYPAVAERMRRMGNHIGGTINVEGEQYRFGSGGAHGGTSAPIPYGDYPITPNTIGAWGAAHGALGINNNAINDPNIGRVRRGIELHAGSSDSLITEGCIAIAGARWPEFKAHVLAMIRKHGRVYLHVGPNGASITPSQRDNAVHKNSSGQRQPIGQARNNLANRHPANSVRQAIPHVEVIDATGGSTNIQVAQ
jgi:hypothetical protein